MLQQSVLRSKFGVRARVYDIVRVLHDAVRYLGRVQQRSDSSGLYIIGTWSQVLNTGIRFIRTTEVL